MQVRKKTVKQLFIKLILVPIRIYQYLISPLFPRCCRFYPSCSEYAAEAVSMHGPVRGVFLAVARIFRCHPFSKAKVLDPVPSEFTWRMCFGYKKRDYKMSGTQESNQL
jgi:putative membrane protein insertion efficiency factor